MSAKSTLLYVSLFTNLKGFEMYKKHVMLAVVLCVSCLSSAAYSEERVALPECESKFHPGGEPIIKDCGQVATYWNSLPPQSHTRDNVAQANTDFFGKPISQYSPAEIDSISPTLRKCFNDNFKDRSFMLGKQVIEQVVSSYKNTVCSEARQKWEAAQPKPEECPKGSRRPRPQLPIGKGNPCSGQFVGF
jgi:hypothetical protein